MVTLPITFTFIQAPGSELSAASFLSFSAHLQVGLRPLSIPFQVQWLLKPGDTIHVLLNNQTVTFETNREDAIGRLGTAASCPLLLPWVRISRVPSAREKGAGAERQWHRGRAAWSPPLLSLQQLCLSSFFTRAGP